ncbi:hypothetical protein LOCC1_G008851 [Lachnellula occidentalis]|uniref:Uncharacterized protein n=1 Tax=Lachnellula occidentalis TaxID=215460 RepID=A0A8H8REG8_9HELO|nr:hypothetical protein LOCC1_G008851 [Lachnellula occidentalis]
MSQSQTTNITFDTNALHRYNTNQSTKSTNSRGSNEVDPGEDEKHDWTQTTDEKDSWANRERRRSSVWNGMDAPGVHKKRADSGASSGAGDRRGSILSLWTSGKDKDGKHIMHHDDHDVAVVEDEQVPVKGPTSPAISPDAPVRDQRRGSILSMWKPGKDEKGRSIIHHADDA